MSGRRGSLSGKNVTAVKKQMYDELLNLYNVNTMFVGGIENLDFLIIRNYIKSVGFDEYNISLNVTKNIPNNQTSIGFKPILYIDERRTIARNKDLAPSDGRGTKEEWKNKMSKLFVPNNLEETTNRLASALDQKPESNCKSDASSSSCSVMGGRRRRRTRKTKRSKRSKRSRGSRRG